MASAKETAATERETCVGMGLTFSWLKESILLIAVSKAVMESRKAWSCSHSGLLSRILLRIATDQMEVVPKIEFAIAPPTLKCVAQCRLRLPCSVGSDGRRAVLDRCQGPQGVPLTSALQSEKAPTH
ncbi:hypothetical protein EYF80_015559 [Liparis tanakae]|uniref:Uncharacterized protein n=1 Tax=Liparis tanakae TaxID=230148 RepID=A0A4Z2I8G8_9TELE|nr:hypothetical protein EYF80_015559 [Liparis tanakae]